MARIAFVENYPYEAIHGGDSEYIQQFASYLTSLGYECHFLVTDIYRGRGKPWYQTPYQIDRYASYKVLNAKRFGKTVFATNVLPWIKKSFIRLLRGAPISNDSDEVSTAEVHWVLSKAKTIGLEVIILCYGANSMAQKLRDSTRLIIALPSNIPGRAMQLNKVTEAIPDWFLKASEDCDIVTTASHGDKQALARLMPDKEIIIVGMGSEQRFLPKPPLTSDPEILFVGNDTPFNRSGINWFLKEAWPAIRASICGVRLRIVGHIARSINESLPGVELVGAVPDLSGEYARVQLVIAPLVEGTGSVKTKVADAISFGRALVTTSVGLDPGDPHQLDDAALIADRGEDFAQCVVELLNDSVKLDRKTAGSHEVYKRLYSKTAAYSAIDARIKAFRPARSIERH